MSEHLLTEEEFVEAARGALDELPPQFHPQLENCAVVVEGHDPDRRLMGVFDPRGGLQRIVLFRDTIEAVSRDRDECLRQVRITVLHEVGHLLGMGEHDLRRVGYG